MHEKLSSENTAEQSSVDMKTLITEAIDQIKMAEHYHGRSDVIHQSKLVDMVTGRASKEEDDPILVRGNAFDLACKLDNYRDFSKTYKATVQKPPSAPMEKEFCELLIKKGIDLSRDDHFDDAFDVMNQNNQSDFWKSITKTETRLKRLESIRQSSGDYVREQIAFKDIDSKYLMSFDDFNAVMIAAEKVKSLTTNELKQIGGVEFYDVRILMPMIRPGDTNSNEPRWIHVGGELDRLHVNFRYTEADDEGHEGFWQIYYHIDDFKFSWYKDYARNFLNGYTYVQYCTYIRLVNYLHSLLVEHMKNKGVTVLKVPTYVNMRFIVGNPNRPEHVIPVDVPGTYKEMFYHNLQTVTGYQYPSVQSLIDEYLIRMEKDDFDSPLEYLLTGKTTVELPSKSSWVIPQIYGGQGESLED